MVLLFETVSPCLSFSVFSLCVSLSQSPFSLCVSFSFSLSSSSGERQGDSELPPSRARGTPPTRVIRFGVAPSVLFAGGLLICGPSVRPACKICARTPCFVQGAFLFTLRRLPPQGEEPSCGSLQILFPHLRLDCVRKPTACRVRHLRASFLSVGHGLITFIRFLQFREKCEAHQDRRALPHTK